jgi:F0F1-type ATP synthase membrane subunit c/vacuolar-type H+-ATPase subunit K
LGWLALGLGLGLFGGILVIVYARKPSLKQQLFYAILGSALSEAVGLFA